MTHAPTSFRLDPALLERLDGYAERLAERTGVPVSRQAALVKLLTEGLDADESTSGRKPRPTSRAPRR